ncbi:MAG: elongation factor P 5-aminopentanone reductase [Clostridiaceae bacterium]
MKLSNKVAIVTGASRGIGRAIALELARQGASVVINYRSSREEALRLLEEIKNNGGSAMVYKADVSKALEAKALVEEAILHYGRVDILINNAGISHIGLFMDMSFEDINNVINTDLLGVINTTKAIVDIMIARKAGVIVNISSIWGESGASCEVVYSAAKAAINGFTKALAKELGPSNIRINAVAPGVIETEMNSWLSKEDKGLIEEDIPLCRMGSTEEVAKVVAFLCSEESTYITGQIINVNGGML